MNFPQKLSIAKKALEKLGKLIDEHVDWGKEPGQGSGKGKDKKDGKGKQPVYTKVTIKEKKDDPKRPQYGQVNEACEILNQKDKCVCYSEHILLVSRSK